MLQEPMMERLLAMRLHGMADALKAQQQDPAARELSFLDRLALLVDLCLACFAVHIVAIREDTASRGFD